MILVQSSQNQTGLYPQLRFIDGFSTLASMASHSSLSTCGHCSPFLLIFWGRMAPGFAPRFGSIFPLGNSPLWGIDAEMFFFVGSFYATPRLGDFSGNRCLLKTPSSVGYAVQGREELFKVVDSLYVGSPRVSGPDSMGRIASRQHRQGNPCCCGVRTVVMDTWGASQFASGLSSKFIAELPSGYLT